MSTYPVQRLLLSHVKTKVTQFIFLKYVRLTQSLPVIPVNFETEVNTGETAPVTKMKHRVRNQEQDYR